MLKLRQFFIILLFTFPFLASFSSNGLPVNFYASYTTPEGIRIISCSEEWDKAKLVELYKEFIENKHGDEFSLLNGIVIDGGAHSSSLTKGSYSALTNTITLYQGDKYTEPADYAETLTHEYGHHFAYHYFPSHHLPFSKWSELRGLALEATRWDAFWNYNESDHALYPQEIFADDYVLLYGATKEMDMKDVFTNEAFYVRTEHENQQLSNVLENNELIEFIEKESGLKVERSRLLQVPVLTEYNDANLFFEITKKANVAYRLNLSFHHEENEPAKEDWELYNVTTENSGNVLQFSLAEIDKEVFAKYEYMTISVDTVDLSTSLGFKSEEIKLRLIQ